MQINTIGVYWKARRESAQECTARLANFFAELASQFPLLADWYQKGESREMASSAQAISRCDEKELLALVASGTNKRDLGRESISELGFSVGLWKPGKDGADFSISITCGLFSSNPGLSNAVVMKLPVDLHSVSLDSIESQKRLLLLLVKAWDAEWGAAYSSRSEVFKDRKSNGPFFDSMLWLRSGQIDPANIAESSFTESNLEGMLHMK